MIRDATAMDDIEPAQLEAVKMFEDAVGVTGVPNRIELTGHQTFLKFVVGRHASVYDHAIRKAQQSLSENHPFKGLMSLAYEKASRFPGSLEADVLLSMLTRSTRHVVQDRPSDAIAVSYVPFGNKEDDKVIQPASHIIAGRRGVGKSTLIARAMELLRDTQHVVIVLDMQAYSNSTEETVYCDVMSDLAHRLADAMAQRSKPRTVDLPESNLREFAEKVLDGEVPLTRMGPALRRLIEKVTKSLGGDVYVFLDDYHVIDSPVQPKLLHLLHGALKGANGWLKVAGLHSLLNCYDPKTRQGIQTPGDAQLVSLDLTLVDPESAERHLAAILLKFLEIVGVETISSIIPEAPLRRLVWATAGVPRDFLEMIGRSLEHAKKAKRPKITFTDANLAIGEFGQRKLDDMERDARNEQQRLRRVVDYIVRFCLEERKEKINAFLVRSEATPERETIQILSDLRIVHLIHPTITPHRAGERYEAFLVDYCLFTGFRRRPNITEMLPDENRQFKATELRKLPALPRDFLTAVEH